MVMKMISEYLRLQDIEVNFWSPKPPSGRGYSYHTQMISEYLKLQEIGVNVWKFSWAWSPKPPNGRGYTYHTKSEFYLIDFQDLLPKFPRKIAFEICHENDLMTFEICYENDLRIPQIAGNRG